MKENNVTAKCKSVCCDWEITGEIEFNINPDNESFFYGSLRGGLVDKCRDHHIEMRRGKICSEHNRFNLDLDNTEIGVAVISSEADTGLVKLDKLREIQERKK